MTESEIERHKVAARKLEFIKNRAFELMKRKLNKISEYDVNKFILSEFKKENLITQVSDKKYVIEKNPAQIIATSNNTSRVHYFPKKKGTKIIKRNNLILVDIWARLDEERAPFADITWMAYSGKNIPAEIERVFDKVIEARNAVINFIERNLANRKLPTTKDVDRVARNYFNKSNLEKYFLHGTGHSLGFRADHGKYFRFGKKSEAKLKPGIPFTIEPGLYFKNEFGVRSEVDCYINENYRLVATTKFQNKIIRL